MSGKKTNTDLGLDDLSLGAIQVYFHESPLTPVEYTKYMNKQYRGINLRMTKNQLGWTALPEARTRIRAIKRLFRESPDSFGSLYRSLVRFERKTLQKRRSGI